MLTDWIELARQEYARRYHEETRKPRMTDAQIREYFELDEVTDLDRPRNTLGFRSYREAARVHFEKWGDVA